MRWLGFVSCALFSPLAAQDAVFGRLPNATDHPTELLGRWVNRTTGAAPTFTMVWTLRADGTLLLDVDAQSYPDTTTWTRYRKTGSWGVAAPRTRVHFPELCFFYDGDDSSVCGAYEFVRQRLRWGSTYLTRRR